MEISYMIPSDQLNEFITKPYGGDAAAALKESVSLDDGAAAVLGDAGMTVLIGLVVVLASLLVLTGIFYLFGFLMSRASKPKTAKNAKKDAAPAKSAAPVASAAPAPAVQAGISDEVVAAIAAAVAMMAPEGKRYAIKSVSRASGGRPAWAAAGVADNTRPF